jgi:hypothetical protein
MKNVQLSLVFAGLVSASIFSVSQRHHDRPASCP